MNKKSTKKLKTDARAHFIALSLLPTSNGA
jgi:hypothetical protein